MLVETTIRPVRTASDITHTARLFEAYATSLDIDLGYQNFAEELATLPGQYAPPRGEILLATGDDADAIGCVALRPLAGNGLCEMKRLYVADAGRGKGVGRALIRAIITAATRIGYREMRLDTLPSMTQAHALYAAAGFTTIAPYYGTAVKGTVFLGRRIGKEDVLF